MLPRKIGGSETEEDGKPGVLIALGTMKKPKAPARIGGVDEEAEDEEGSITNEQAFDDAVSEMLAAVGASKQSHSRFKQAFKAACYACDAEPHDEGEHTEEEGSD